MNRQYESADPALQGKRRVKQCLPLKSSLNICCKCHPDDFLQSILFKRFPEVFSFNAILALTNSLQTNYLTPNEAKKYDIKIAMDGVKRSCLEIIGQRNINSFLYHHPEHDRNSQLYVFQPYLDRYLIVLPHFVHALDL